MCLTLGGIPLINKNEKPIFFWDCLPNKFLGKAKYLSAVCNLTGESL